MTLTVTEPLGAQQPALGPLTAEEGAPLHRVTFAPMDDGERGRRGARNARRRRVARPSDAYEERLGDGDRLFIEDAGPRALGLDDASIFLKWRAASSSDGRSVLSLKTVAWLPAQTNRVGDRSANVALVGLGRLGVGAWYLHGMLGASTARTSPELATTVRAASFSFSVALERSLGSSLAGVLQYQIAPPVLRGFGHRELDGVASNVVFGLAGRWGEAWGWDVGFQEDVPTDTPAIDFTLGVRVSRSWQ